MQQLFSKKLSYCNNSRFTRVFEVPAFFLVEGLVSIALVAVMAGALSVLLSYAATYSARMRLLHGGLEVACSALDAVVYGAALPETRQQGDYTVTVLRAPTQHTQDAVMVRVKWQYRGTSEQIELTSVRRQV